MRKQATPTKTQEFSLFVKTLAKERRLSLRQISKEIQVAPSYLSEVLTGRKRPSPQLLAALANFFKIPKVDVYNAAGWLSLSDNEQLIERFKEVSEKDPYIIDLFEILFNIPEAERRLHVRLLLAHLKANTAEPPLGWISTRPDGTIETYFAPDAEERDKANNKKSRKSDSR